MRIEYTIDKSVPACEWQQVANRKGRELISKAGGDFKAAEILVTLPERGRYMIKSPGRVTFQSVG